MDRATFELFLHLVLSLGLLGVMARLWLRQGPALVSPREGLPAPFAPAVVRSFVVALVLAGAGYLLATAKADATPATAVEELANGLGRGVVVAAVLHVAFLLAMAFLHRQWAAPPIAPDRFDPPHSGARA